MFQRRLRQGDTVWTHETLYPILQGYDSVAMDVDLEIGGTDQVFNMLIGRELQRKMKNREKFVLTVPMILGTDNKQMSKTSENCIWLTDSANQMFGKIMSMPDELIINYFETLTNIPLTEIKQIARDIKSKKLNPKQAKSILAKEIVAMYHNKPQADKSEKEFNKVFKEKLLPSDIKSIKIKEKEMNILDLLVKTKMASSKGEARRTIVQNGVKIDNKVQNNWKKIIAIKSGLLIQVGKRKFIRIIP
jgi:tyrosyl-tRNA synthetase